MLPAVAIRTMVHALPVITLNTLDVRQFVNDTGGEQDFAAMQHRPIEEAKLKAAIFFAHAHHGGLAQLNAVPLHFLTRELMKFPGNDRIAREESVDAAR